MKTMTPILALAISMTAQAKPLPAEDANTICRAKALRAARFISESKVKLSVSYKVSQIAEISTPIIYEFHVRQLQDPIYTVTAYAYPDDRTCTIGMIRNNVAGND